MGRGTAAAVIIIATAHLALSACQRTETTNAAPPGQSQEAKRLQASYERSKEAIALTVNGEAVTEFFVLREMNAIAPRYLRPGQGRTPEIDARIRRDALDIVIFQTLAVQEARRRGMKVKREDIDEALESLRTGMGSAGAFREYLAGNGLSEEELRRVLEQEHLFELIAVREIDDKITITDAAVRARYEREKAGLRDAAHRQMSFPEAKGMIEQRLREEAGEGRLREWQAELKRNARIEIMGQQKKTG